MQAVGTSNSKPVEIVITDANRKLLPGLREDLTRSHKHIERFFDHTFLTPYRVDISPHRKAFDGSFGTRFGVPKTEKWMVAAGVSDTLYLLSPQVWKTEAVEHDPADKQHVRDILTHELVHVYHGQYCPKHDFEGMDDLGWLVEGVAVYVSGQLEHSHRDAARKAIAEGVAPTKLANAWSGRYRYGVCGSLVGYVDKRYGRKTLWKLLAITRPDQALGLLGITETQLLEDWKRSIAP